MTELGAVRLWRSDSLMVDPRLVLELGGGVRIAAVSMTIMIPMHASRRARIVRGFKGNDCGSVDARLVSVMGGDQVGPDR